MSKNRQPSIRRFLFASIISLVMISTGFAGIYSYVEAKHEVGEILDAQLAQSARILASIFANAFDTLNYNGQPLVYEDWETHYPIKPDDEQTPYGHAYENLIAFQWFTADGTMIMRSPSAPETNLKQLSPGFGQTNLNGKIWRTFALQDQTTQQWLVVAEAYDANDELIDEISELSAYPIFFTLPILIVLLVFALRRGLSPLQALSQQLSELNVDNLHPIRVEPLAVEIEPVQQAINTMIQEIDDAFDRERQFTAEASHELRTPLSILKIHVQNALNAKDSETRDISLAHVSSGIERCSRLLSQLLTLAKADSHLDANSLTSVNLNVLARRIIADISPIAMQKQQELSLHSNTEHAMLLGNETLLEQLLINLLDNAIQYSPNDASIDVDIRESETQLILTVQDCGPGVPPEKIEKLTQRFYRGTQEKEGAGLGLAIIKRICDIHHAKLNISNRPAPGSGLRVDIVFPDRGR